MIRWFKKIIYKFRKDHHHIIEWKYFRIYHKGFYSRWSFEFGRPGHGEFVILIRCNDKFLNWKFYHSIDKMVKTILKTQGIEEG
jgi:hypothetical protein